MSLDSKHWRRPLTQPLRTTEGETLVTLEDAAAYTIRVEKTNASREPWRQATRLLARAAETGKADDVVVASTQMEAVMLFHGKLALRPL